MQDDNAGSAGRRITVVDNSRSVLGGMGVGGGMDGNPLIDNGLMGRQGWRGKTWGRRSEGECHGRGGRSTAETGCGAGCGGTTAAGCIDTPAMDCPQVSRHIILPVKLLVADSARIGFTLQVCGHVVAMEVAGVCVSIVTHLTSVCIPVLNAETADRDGCGSLS